MPHQNNTFYQYMGKGIVTFGSFGQSSSYQKTTHHIFVIFIHSANKDSHIRFHNALHVVPLFYHMVTNMLRVYWEINWGTLCYYKWYEATFVISVTFDYLIQQFPQWYPFGIQNSTQTPFRPPLSFYLIYVYAHRWWTVMQNISSSPL